MLPRFNICLGYYILLPGDLFLNGILMIFSTQLYFLALMNDRCRDNLVKLFLTVLRFLQHRGICLLHMMFRLEVVSMLNTF